MVILSIWGIIMGKKKLEPPKGISNEILYKEIDLIQGCICRMASNSFTCKGWNLTLISGVFALSSKDINKAVLCIFILCINFCFWWLDTFFLLQERRYRNKYNWVIKNRLNGNAECLYDLNPKNETIQDDGVRRIRLKDLCSLTTTPMYVGITVLAIICLIYILM